MENVSFRGGENIAIKIPAFRYEATIHFYREVLKLETEEVTLNHPTVSKSHKIKFGEITLWLDCVDTCSHSETWLEIKTNKIDNALDHLKEQGIQTRNELEQLPEGSHWISDPAGTVLLLSPGSQ